MTAGRRRATRGSVSFYSLPLSSSSHLPTSTDKWSVSKACLSPNTVCHAVVMFPAADFAIAIASESCLLPKSQEYGYNTIVRIDREGLLNHAKRN